MDIYIALATGCLIVIAASSAFRIIAGPTLSAEAAATAVQDARRRANDDRAALLARIGETRAAWAAVMRSENLERPVEVMLEIKQIDRIAERVANTEDDLRAIPKAVPNQPTNILQKHHAQVWKQVSVLNVCQSDILASQTRLRRLKTAQQRAAVLPDVLAA
jgi:hypothetical protein